jgi:hypothetical protein
MVMGFPAVYSSNQGREFANGIVKQLVEKTKMYLFPDLEVGILTRSIPT